MSPHAVQFHEAVDALQFFAGWSGGWMPIERRREGAVRLFWRDATRPGLASLIRDLDERYSDEIALGLPQAKRFNGGVGTSTLFWAWVEGSDQVKRARMFKPHPTIVLQVGASSKRLLIWALERPVTYFEAVEANRRISYALRARQREGDPDLLWIPCPGTCLRVGRSRPAPVVCARLTTETFEPVRVVGRLREPPARDSWLQVAGSGR